MVVRQLCCRWCWWLVVQLVWLCSSEFCVGKRFVSARDYLAHVERMD